jgi:uncharacterized membrane protein YfhO
MFHPFWSARIDSIPVTIEPALYLFRSVKVPAGVHKIEFSCNIPFFKGSIIISLMCVLITFLGYFTFPTIREFIKRALHKKSLPISQAVPPI